MDFKSSLTKMSLAFALAAGAAIGAAAMPDQAQAMTSPQIEEVQSRTPCAPAKSVWERLGDRYGETRQFAGLIQGRSNAPPMAVEIYLNEESGSWTLLRTATDGQACLLASGQQGQKDVALDPQHSLAFQGAMNDGSMVAVNVQAESGAFRIARLLPTGRMVPLMQGSNWQVDNNSPVVPGNDASYSAVPATPITPSL